MASRVRLLITTGDPDGVGLEVSVKALAQLGPQSQTQFILFRAPTKKALVVRGFRIVTVSTLDAALQQSFQHKTLIEIVSSESPAKWVADSAQACMKEEFLGMVTAPLSKTSIVNAGFKDLGHTEILARVSGQRDLFMGFLGSKFNVVLGTGHLSLQDAARRWSPGTLSLALAAANEMRGVLPAAVKRKPIGLVGLNPHAGENGLIGSDESWMSKQINETTGRLPIVGPLVPDAAFLPHQWKRFSVYVCPYHDQGLIPFKLVHGFSQGVHLTLGLPFVRTSVDHGTAKDLFGKNKANPGSMKEALKTAIKLVKEKSK